MIKETSQQTVRSLLSKNNDKQNDYRYIIPPYQREYSWQREQWDELFDDIQDNDAGYFLGSTICILSDDNAANKYQEVHVVDGQQRLTTLSLLLLAIYEKLKSLISSAEIKDWLHDNDTLLEIWVGFKKYFLYNKESRLVPSIQNTNKDDYTYLVNNIVTENKNTEKPSHFNNRRIAKAFNHFHNKLENLLSSQNKLEQTKFLFDFHEKIANALVVRIDTQDTTSAFILFESINNRGTSLLPMDLIKNSIIGRLSDNPEQTNQTWQKIINNIKDSTAQISYLRHFYQAFRHEGILFSKTKGTDKITKTKLIPVYTDAVREKPDSILQELTKKSDIYKNFVSPEQIEASSEFEKYKNKLIDLDKLSIIPSYTLLLYLFSRYPKQNFSNLLNYLEKWFIVRHLTNIPMANKLDGIFISLVKEQQTEYNENLLIEHLDKELPPKERITADLQNKDIYEDNTNLVRYLLVYLEQMRRTKENRTDFWQERSKKKPIWSVEHIYPQHPKKGEWADNCQPWLHALGNLTLTAYNSNLSNKSFSEKAFVLDKDNKDIGLKSGNVKINDYLRDKEEWTAEHIQERQAELIDQFIQSLKS